ncbi:MAG: sulfite exporter TauE/SafE family protein [Oscillospiraceae bacterium]|nr:sulfite exporter TauE/SafE family protein [Oscillospiraceae bacterium]
MQTGNKRKKLFLLITGALCGFLNGFFGAGGGTVAVPMLRKSGLGEKEAHATSVAVILAVTAVSAAFYLIRGSVAISDTLGYIYTGVFGAAIGAYVLKKISVVWLKRIFGALIMAASVRMFLR